MWLRDAQLPLRLVGPAGLAGLVGLAACFAPAAPAGAPCASASSAERCPAGQVCVTSGGAEVCVEPGGGSGSGSGDGGVTADDQDGDGYLDELDNCPLAANADQADEDDDALGDVCDPCPPFAANGDGDGDGVGEGCDPHPQTTGDRIVAFEGFAGAVPAAWTAIGSVSTAGGDMLATAAANAGAVLAIASPAVDHVEIRAAATLVGVSGTALGAIGVVDRLEPGTDRTVACQLTGFADGGQQELRIFNTGANMLVDVGPHPFAAGTSSELRLRRDGTSYACRATSPSLEISGGAAFNPAGAQIGLRVRSATARYHWVMIVTSP